MGNIPRGIEWNPGVPPADAIVVKRDVEPMPRSVAHEDDPEVAAEIPEEIAEILRAHVVEVDPGVIGSSEMGRQMTDAAIGARRVMITRCDPSISVESATAARGKLRVLIGRNGSGKTTAFDAFMGRGNADFDVQHGQGAVVYGRPAHERKKLRIARLDQEELLGRVEAYSARAVLENAAAYFKREFSVDWSDAGNYERNLSNQDAQVRIDKLMSQIAALFDMEEFLETEVGKLSGGERTKLALFMILLSEPDALLLDEPTNHLDLRSISKLTALFNKYKQAGVSIVSVSHVDWFLQEAGTDGVMEMAWDGQGRRLTESTAPYGAYIKDVNRDKGRVPILSGDLEWPQQEYNYKESAMLVECPTHFSIPDSPLQEVAMPSIYGGRVTVVSGDNGSGKTKLMEAMIFGRRTDGPRRQKGAQIAYLPQFWPEEIARGSLQDFFHYVKNQASPHSTGSSVHPEKPAQKCFVELAGKLNFGGSSRIGEAWLRRPFARFSGGEQRLLWFLAVSALRDVDMLALDEPTNHMDRDSQARVASAIKRFPGAVVLSTHDRNLMQALSKDVGAIHGIARDPAHLVLEKKNGRTTISESRQSPIEYMTTVMVEAKKQAKRLKI